jgi:hypothetical protein
MLSSNQTSPSLVTLTGGSLTIPGVIIDQKLNPNVAPKSVDAPISAANALAVANSIAPNKAYELKVAELMAAYTVANAQDIDYNGTKFQADLASKGLLQSAIVGFQFLQETPTGFYWKASDNSKLIFSYQNLLALANAMAQPVAVNFAKLQELKTQAAAAKTLAELNAVTWI